VADTTNYAVGAKGDLLAGTAADTVAALAVGNDGEQIVADSSATTGLRYQGNFAAGKNKIINGDFGIWQRGTTQTYSTAGGFGPDRWRTDSSGAGTVVISQQSFTAGTAPVAGYEGTFFCRLQRTVLSGVTDLLQRIEDVRTFANQTVTVSFWAKADTTRTVEAFLLQVFGSGGSGDVGTSTTSFSVTTSWARYTTTLSVPSISGKTIGTGNYLGLFLRGPNALCTLDFWGVQVEAGSVATAFQTATGTLQGELAACQRYYAKSYSNTVAPATATTAGWVDVEFPATGTLTVTLNVKFPVEMRSTPTVTLYDDAGNSGKVYRGASNKTATTKYIGTAGFNGGTTDNTSASEIGFHYVASAEL